MRFVRLAKNDLCNSQLVVLVVQSDAMEDNPNSLSSLKRDLDVPQVRTTHHDRQYPVPQPLKTMVRGQ